MNILWIEDFGGGLPTGTGTLSSIFLDLISFDSWDEDELSLLNCPNDLEKFCKENSALHCVFLCRHYFDYVEFKKANELIQIIDAVIIDIRLNNKIDFDLPIPNGSQTKAKFHEEAGFYIFNDLVHLGIPADKMCFLTGEISSLDEFSKKCAEIYIPQVKSFEKKDAEWEKLRKWIKEQESDYAILRRGIIEGCQFAKNLTIDKLYFNKFTNNNESVQPEDIFNYLEILKDFLPLREPVNKADLYKLFIRTLSHEWEAAKNIKRDNNKKDAALAWIMRNTRHWITHNSKLFSALDEGMLAYLFIVNLRVMFNFDDDKLQCHEEILLKLLAEEALSEAEFKAKSIPVSDAYLKLKNIVLDEKHSGQYQNVEDAFYFNELANNIQLSNSSRRNDKDLFSKLLYQMFWLTTSNPFVSTGNRKNLLEIKFWDFNYAEKPYLFELARHIYNRSFSSDEKL
jgi:hypothetical protein